MAIVMLCYARSGGTLLNKCLGALPDTVVLSEVNPVGGGAGEQGVESYTTVREQAIHWYGIDVETDDFADGVVRLDVKCRENGKHLIIRDWSYVNFSDNELNRGNPSGRFLTLEKLNGKLEIRTFAFVRDSIDVWISRGCPDVNKFFCEYLEYVEQLDKLGIRIFKYEDFCAAPMKVLKGICDYTGLEYSDVSESYMYFRHANGDTQGPSRGNVLAGIKKLPRRVIPLRKVFAVNRSRMMRRANSLLGYRTRYYDNLFVYIKQYIRNKAKTVIRMKNS